MAVSAQFQYRVASFNVLEVAGLPLPAFLTWDDRLQAVAYKFAIDQPLQ